MKRVPRKGVVVVLAAAMALTGTTATAAPGGPVTHEENERVPDGAAWTQHYFPSADGAELHADVLLPEGLAAGEKVR